MPHPGPKFNYPPHDLPPKIFTQGVLPPKVFIQVVPPKVFTQVVPPDTQLEVQLVFDFPLSSGTDPFDISQIYIRLFGPLLLGPRLSISKPFINTGFKVDEVKISGNEAKVVLNTGDRARTWQDINKGVQEGVRLLNEAKVVLNTVDTTRTWQDFNRGVLKGVRLLNVGKVVLNPGDTTRTWQDINRGVQEGVRFLAVLWRR